MSSMSLLFLLTTPSWANTWTVSSGGSIQSAINSASSGDTIQIESGTYFECLDPSGVDITLEGLGTVLINGSSCTSTVQLTGSETITVSNVQLRNAGGPVLTVGAMASATLSSVTVSNSGTTNQSQSSLGGAIVVEGLVQIEDSTFSSNSGGLGGVIYTEGGFVSISDSTFTGNSALNGAVLYARDGAFVSSTNNLFQNNMANSFGGVYDFLYGVDFVESGSTYDSNMSNSHGGVLYANHNVSSFQPNTISISGATFVDNQATSGSFSSGSGGALYVYNRSTVSIENTVFEGNSATNGGALWVVAANDTLTILDSTFIENTADQSGAIGVMASGSSAATDLMIEDSTFTDNEALYGYGGAISLGSVTSNQSYGTVVVDNSTFEGNQSMFSASASGGALLINTSSSDDVWVSNSLFDGNVAHSSGGALYVNGAQDVEIVTSRFIENEASSPASYTRFGGAVQISNVDSIQLNNSILCGNRVTKFSTLNAYGAGFYAGNVSDVSVSNVIFQENESEQNGGAVAFDTIDSVSFINNTFVGNVSTQGDDLWLTMSPTELINNIFAQSSASASVYAADGSSASMGVTYNDWYNNAGNASGSFAFSVVSDGNMANNPLFTLYSQDGNCENDVLTLDSTSSLVDAGDPTRFDLNGSRSDIGAFGGTGLLDGDGDGFGALVDCDDNNASAYPGAAFLESTSACMSDSDGDGYGDANPVSALVQPGQDCDDADFSIKPGAVEFCDGIDNDCNNQIDDNPVGGSLYYADADGDGIGGSTTIQSCNAVNGASSETGDCDDLDPFTYPGAAENDSSTSCMRDVDGDGYGDAAPTNSGVSSGSDCDDMQSAVNPTAAEVPADGVDQNCDNYEACFQDADLDGFGSTTVTTSASFTCSGLAIADNDDDCDDNSGQTFPGAAEYDSATACMADNDGDGYGYMIAPAGGVGGNDCDDTNPSVYFGAPEIPGDGISQDCDNTEDCYVDNDGDGYGSTSIVSSFDLDCDDAGESENSADCDDSTVDIAPNATEIPYDGIDQDCDPSTVDDDLDGDGYGVGDGDCDDANPDRNPGATDIPDDGIDQDCDGVDATDDPEDTGEPATEPSAEPSAEPSGEDTSDPDTDIKEEDITEKPEGCSTSTLSSGSIGIFGTLWGLLLLRRRQD